LFVFFFQAEDGIRDFHVTEFRRVLFRSTAEQARPEAAPAPRPAASRRIILLTAGGVLLLAVLAAIGWFALGPSDDREPEVGDVQIGRASCRESVYFTVC